MANVHRKNDDEWDSWALYIQRNHDKPITVYYIYIIFGKGHFTQVKNEWKRHWIEVLHGVAKLQLRSCLFRMSIFQQPK